MAAYDGTTSARDSMANDSVSVGEQTSDHSSIDSPASADITDQLVLAASPSAARNARRTIGAWLKPLIVIMTSQYVIVTALVALAAVTVASEAAKIINAKLELIMAALKRF